MTKAKVKRAARDEGVRRGGRPREVDGDAIEFTIRLGSNQLSWLERRYGGAPAPDGETTRTRAGLVRDLVDEVRGGKVRRAAHWPPRAVVGAFVDPRGSGVAVVVLVTTASRPRLVAGRVFRGVEVEPEALASAVRQVVVGTEAEGDPIDLAALGYLVVPTDVGRHAARATGIAWGVVFAALRGAALQVTEPTDREVKARASVEIGEAVTGWDAAEGDHALLAAAAFCALSGIDREAATRDASKSAE